MQQCCKKIFSLKKYPYYSVSTLSKKERIIGIRSSSWSGSFGTRLLRHTPPPPDDEGCGGCGVTVITTVGANPNSINWPVIGDTVLLSVTDTPGANPLNNSNPVPGDTVLLSVTVTIGANPLSNKIPVPGCDNLLSVTDMVGENPVNTAEPVPGEDVADAPPAASVSCQK